MLRTSVLLLTLSVGLLAQKREVTVVLEFAAGSSPHAREEMQLEAERIAQKAGVALTFMSPQLAAGQSFAELIVFKVKGRCEMAGFPSTPMERGPLGWTFITDDRILPFGELQCDRIRESLRSVVAGAGQEKGNKLLGRAMGRVVAHELFHMLTESTSHGKSGVAKDSLSARQLVAETLDFSDHDVSALDADRYNMGR